MGADLARDNFYTQTICRDPRRLLPARVSDLSLLEPTTRERVLVVIEEARKLGQDLMVYETFRSSARQLALFRRGATKRRVVGVHLYGLACDIVKSIDGDPSWKGSFALLGRLARRHGLLWGGDWGDPTRKHDFVDAVHVQRCSLKRQPALFAGRWYPDAGYDALQDR
jgi:hypothetical protein